MTRYAVYAVPGVLGADDAPEARSLLAAARSWYGRREVRDLTVSARRYGFHATLKAPFRLAAGRTAAQLMDAAAAFAAARGPLVIPAPELRALGDFRALVPGGEETDLNALAAAAVRDFDGFRAPLTEEDRRRRRPERMGPRERALFEQWGYPHVLERFRFHMTLTDPVPADRAGDIDTALAAHFAGTLGVSVRLAALALCREPGPGEPFEVLSAHPFHIPTAAPPEAS